jgi:hypothetical protein
MVTEAAIRSTSGASVAADISASRTTAPRSALCSDRVLPDLPRDQDAAATQHEVLPIMRFGAAPARDQSGSWVGGLDAVAQPVGAAGCAGQPPQLRVEPVDVRLVGVVGGSIIGVGAAMFFARYFVR